MEILEKIFGSAAKVKIMRLFLFNPEIPFDLDKTTVRAKITPQAARLNIRMLEQAGLLKSKVFFIDKTIHPEVFNYIKKKMIFKPISHLIFCHTWVCSFVLFYHCTYNKKSNTNKKSVYLFKNKISFSLQSLLLCLVQSH